MLPLHTLLPVDEIAPPLAVTYRLGIRRRDYLLHELYCPEDGCDCRRVMLKVCDAQTGRTIATISHGFDVPEPRFADLGQTYLDPIHEQTRKAPKMLGMVCGLVDDPTIVARFERHYALVKAAVANPDERLRALLEDNPDPLRAVFGDKPAFSRRDSRSSSAADVESLQTAGRSLARNVRKAIVARGAAVIPELLEIVADPEAWEAEDEDEGFVVVHALTLLAELGASEAIGVALEQLEDEAIDDSLWDRALEALAGFGAAALEPLVALYDSHLEAGEEAEQTFDRRLGICRGLACLRVRDDRIWSRLSTIFTEDPPVVAALLSTYGDRRARALLSETLDQWEIDPSMPAHNLAIEVMAESLEALRGTLTNSQAAKRKRVRRLGRRRATAANKSNRSGAELQMPSADVKLSRNGPCWCGSGKKYKRCHAKSDQSVDVKMSDALVEVADPITDDDPDRLRAAMTTTAAAWNCAVMERSDGQDHVLEFIARMGQEVGFDEIDGIEEILRMLVARKQALFPDDDRIVGKVAVLETEGGLRVQAAYTRPGSKSVEASGPSSSPADHRAP